MRILPLLFTIIALSPYSYIHSARRKSLAQKNNIVSAININNNQKPIIVFDLINVLFKESYTGFAQKIGYATLANYALTHWKNPGYRCLDMLHTMSEQPQQQPKIILTVSGRTMPHSIVELQEGKKTCKDTHTEITKAIERLQKIEFFSSNKEKNLMSSIMSLMLNPNVLSEVTEPIKPMITLVQKLKKNGYTLYLCANVPNEFYTELEKKYPEIITLFDGVVISAHIQQVKPEKEIFEHLLTTYKLTPSTCIIIDTDQKSIDTAQSLGMQGIVYDKISQLTAELKKRGVIL